MKIAIFLPNWLGDLTMATPAVRAMRRHFGPQARLVGILRPYLADVLAGTGWLDEQWFFDPRAGDRELRGRAIARRMRAAEFDLALLMTHSLRTAWLAWRGRARERVGYVRDGRGVLLTGKLYPRLDGRRRRPEPMVESYLDLARALGCPDGSPRLELATLPADERSADAVSGRLGLRSDGRVAALNCSGAFGAAKLWPVEYFGRLARRIVEKLDHDVLVTCGPRERDIAREVVRLAGCDRVFSMADQPLDLGTAKACIRPAGRHAVWPDVARLEREPHAAGDQSGARLGLHRLPPTDVPAGAPPLHARAFGRSSLRRGARDIGPNYREHGGGLIS
jgi:heptosyltransferase-2